MGQTLPSSSPLFVSSARMEGEKAPWRQGWSVQVFFFLLTLVTGYLGGVFFLIPYFSVTGGYNQYSMEETRPDADPSNLFIPADSYLTYIRSVHNTGGRPFQVALISGFVANATTTGACPPGFYKSGDVLNEDCVNIRETKVSFLQVNPEYNEYSERYSGVRERPMQVNEYGYTFAHDIAVKFVVRLIRFDPERACTTEEDCSAFLHDLSLPDDPTQVYDIWYENSTLHCYTKERSVLSGCGISVHIGGPERCPQSPYFYIREKGRGPCAFTVFWGLFLNPPGAFTMLKLWSWGPLGFIGFLFLYFWSATYYGRILQRGYLRSYYFRTNNLTLKRGAVYDFKIYVSGEQFTSHRGMFHIYHAGRSIFAFPLVAKFMAEEMDGTKISSLFVRGIFIPDADYGGAHFDVEWKEDFSMARFVEPGVQVVFRKRIPKRVKTIFNLALMPAFFVMGLLLRNPRPSQFIRFRRYLLLVLYFACVHCGFWAVVGYFSGAYSSSNNQQLWGDFDTRPAGPVVLYTLFLMLLWIPICIALYFSIWPIEDPPLRPLMQQKTPRQARTAVLVSKPREENAVIVSHPFLGDVNYLTRDVRPLSREGYARDSQDESDSERGMRRHSRSFIRTAKRPLLDGKDDGDTQARFLSASAPSPSTTFLSLPTEYATPVPVPVSLSPQSHTSEKAIEIAIPASEHGPHE